MEQIIKSHNKKTIYPKSETNIPCNCRKNKCPLDGKCRANDVMYDCVASTSIEPFKYYIGISKGEWKGRYNVHGTSFRHEKYEHDTLLSKYVWESKRSINEFPNLKWSILKTAPSYNNISKRCLLCLNEKLAIVTYPDDKVLLNKRTEMIAKCRHENAYLLSNYDKNKDRRKEEIT